MVRELNRHENKHNMKIDNYTIRTLESAEGYTLHKKGTNVYSKKVYLAFNDTQENWEEVLDSEVPKSDTL